MLVTLKMEFSQEEIIDFLNKEGYKIVEHKCLSIHSRLPIYTTEKFAVPKEEDFDDFKHRDFKTTFETLINKRIKEKILN